MNNLQKQAWGNLVIIIGVFPFTALFTLMSVKIFRDTFSVELIARISANFTFCALIGAGLQASYVFRGRKLWKKVWFDERDHLINYRAILYAYYAVCISLIVGYIFSGFWEQNGLIPSYVLLLFLSGIALIAISVYSTVILVQYGWGDKNGK